MQKNLQEKILENILHRYPKKPDAVYAISQLLGVGKDAVYRRLRGDTFLNPDELSKLSQHFQISLDSLVFERTDTVFFVFNMFSKPVKSFEDYVESVYTEIFQLQRLPDAHVQYATTEIPIFYYTLFPELFCFKLYTWGRTVWDFPYLRKHLFDFSLVAPPVIAKMSAVMRLYFHLPSTEIWSVGIVDNTLGQIEFHLNSGGFKNPPDALTLCDCLRDLTRHLRLMATEGFKVELPDKAGNIVHNSPFQLYHNEMVNTNNTIFVTTAVGRVLFTTLATPNFIRSTDERVCDYKEEWFQMIISKSIPITTQSEKSRDWFFNRLEQKIALVRRRIELVLSE